MQAIANTKVIRNGVLVPAGTPFDILPVEVDRASALGWKVLPESVAPISGGNNIQAKPGSEVNTGNLPEKISESASDKDLKILSGAKPSGAAKMGSTAKRPTSTVTSQKAKE